MSPTPPRWLLNAGRWAPKRWTIVIGQRTADGKKRQKRDIGPQTPSETPDEGLLVGEPIAGKAKVMIAFNANPQLAVAMAPFKEKIGETKMKEFSTYRTAHLRMATGYLLQKMGGKKSDSAGPKTQLERVVEGNMRAMRGRGRTW